MQRESLKTIDEKLETLVKQRMEGAGFPVPNTIRLGTLRKIASELGINVD